MIDGNDKQLYDKMSEKEKLSYGKSTSLVKRLLIIAGLTFFIAIGSLLAALFKVGSFSDSGGQKAGLDFSSCFLDVERLWHENYGKRLLTEARLQELEGLEIPKQIAQEPEPTLAPAAPAATATTVATITKKFQAKYNTPELRERFVEHAMKRGIPLEEVKSIIEKHGVDLSTMKSFGGTWFNDDKYRKDFITKRLEAGHTGSGIRNELIEAGYDAVKASGIDELNLRFSWHIFTEKVGSSYVNFVAISLTDRLSSGVRSGGGYGKVVIISLSDFLGKGSGSGLGMDCF